MLPIILPLMFVHLILNNSNFTNASSTSGLLQGVNAGLQTQTTIPNPLGDAILFILFIVASSVTAFKVDLPVAAAFGSLITTVIAVLLQTPGLALVGSTMPYIFGGLTVMFIFIALLAGAKSPFR